MLGLGLQIRNDKLRVAETVGNDDKLRGSGDHIDIDVTKDLAFRFGHIGVAGPDDLIDFRDSLGAEGKRCYSLRPLSQSSR